MSQDALPEWEIEDGTFLKRNGKYVDEKDCLELVALANAYPALNAAIQKVDAVCDDWAAAPHAMVPRGLIEEAIRAVWDWRKK